MLISLCILSLGADSPPAFGNDAHSLCETISESPRRHALLKIRGFLPDKVGIPFRSFVRVMDGRTRVDLNGFTGPAQRFLAPAENFSLSLMLKEGVLSWDDTQAVKEISAEIAPERIHVAEVFDAENVEVPAAALRLISGQTPEEIDHLGRASFLMHHSLPWMVELSELAKVHVNRAEHKFIWELGRGARTRPFLIPWMAKELVRIAIRELVLLGGDPDDGFIYVHATSGQNADLYQSAYGFSPLAQSGHHTILSQSLRSLSKKFHLESEFNWRPDSSLLGHGAILDVPPSAVLISPAPPAVLPSELLDSSKKHFQVKVFLDGKREKDSDQIRRSLEVAAEYVRGLYGSTTRAELYVVLPYSPSLASTYSAAGLQSVRNPHGFEIPVAWTGVAGVDVGTVSHDLFEGERIFRVSLDDLAVLTSATPLAKPGWSQYWIRSLGVME